MDAQANMLFSFKFCGVRKLYACDVDKSFQDVVSQIRLWWPHLKTMAYKLYCEVGDLNNVSFDSDEDLRNIFNLCFVMSIKVVNVEIVVDNGLCSIGPVACNEAGHYNQCLNKGLVESNCRRALQVSPSVDVNIEGRGVYKSSKGHDIVGRNPNGAIIEDQSASLVERDPLLSDEWASLMKCGVGAIFSGGAKQFRSCLIKYSLKSGFKFKYHRNDSRYVHAVCIHKGAPCDWFIKGKLGKNTSSFVVVSINVVHKCVGNLIGKDTKRLVSRMVGQFFLADVKDNPNISGKELIHKMKNLYGFDIPYWKAHRAVEHAREYIYGTYEESYNEFRWYCDALKRINPGSVVELQCNEQTHQFERLFIAFKACLDGFPYCRPLIFLDGTFLKGRAKGTLLSATAKDGNNGLFPVAFAIVSAENNDNWVWFLTMVRSVLIHKEQILYFSDRHLGILHAFNELCDEPIHFFCLYHLLSNLKVWFSKGWKSKNREKLCELFRECAYASDLSKFDASLQVFRKLGGRLADEFLEELPYEKWAVCYAPNVTRYGEMTSNAAKSFNACIANARSLPVCCMVEEIRSKISDWFVSRRLQCDSWTGALVCSKEELWNFYVQRSSNWNVVECPSGVYKVGSKPSAVVDIHGRYCSCSQWQLKGFPCVHAVGVIKLYATSIFHHVEEYFFTTTYKKCYESNINPIPETEKLKYKEKEWEFKILPPCLGKRPGRPKKSRNLSYGEYYKKKKVICRKCGKIGRHDEITCGLLLEKHNTLIQEYHPMPCGDSLNSVGSQDDEEPQNRCLEEWFE